MDAAGRRKWRCKRQASADQPAPAISTTLFVIFGLSAASLAHCASARTAFVLELARNETTARQAPAQQAGGELGGTGSPDRPLASLNVSLSQLLQAPGEHQQRYAATEPAPSSRTSRSQQVALKRISCERLGLVVLAQRVLNISASAGALKRLAECKQDNLPDFEPAEWLVREGPLAQLSRVTPEGENSANINANNQTPSESSRDTQTVRQCAHGVACDLERALSANATQTAAGSAPTNLHLGAKLAIGLAIGCVLLVAGATLADSRQKPSLRPDNGTRVQPAKECAGANKRRQREQATRFFLDLNVHQAKKAKLRDYRSLSISSNCSSNLFSSTNSVASAAAPATTTSGTTTTTTPAATVPANTCAQYESNLQLHLVSQPADKKSEEPVAENQQQERPSPKHGAVGEAARLSGTGLLALQLLLAFSLRRTVAQIFGQRTDSNKMGAGQAQSDSHCATEAESVDSLHGLRFFSMIWVIVIHSYNFALRWMFFSNTNTLDGIYKSAASQFIANGSFACDSFFFVGGFLIPYLALEQRQGPEAGGCAHEGRRLEWARASSASQQQQNLDQVEESEELNSERQAAAGLQQRQHERSFTRAACDAHSQEQAACPCACGCPTCLDGIYKSAASQFIANGSFACDSFFFVGGFLIPYLALEQRQGPEAGGCAHEGRRLEWARASSASQQQQNLDQVEESEELNSERQAAAGLQQRQHERSFTRAACDAHSQEQAACPCACGCPTCCCCSSSSRRSFNSCPWNASSLPPRRRDSGPPEHVPVSRLASNCDRRRAVEAHTNEPSALSSSGSNAHGRHRFKGGSAAKFSSLEGRTQPFTARRLVANIVRRYVRMMPLMMAIIGLCASLLRYLGSGPVWEESTLMYDQWCRRNWWVNALFLHNFVNRENMCLSHSWYSAVDFQLFLVAQLLLLVLSRSRRAGLALLAGLLLASPLVTMLLTLKHRLPAVPLVSSVDEETMNVYYGQVYIKPYSRASPYLIGVLLAYLMRTTRLGQWRLKKWQVAVGWLAALSLFVAIILAMQPAMNGRAPTALESALYSGWSRPLWACATGWMIFACITRQGGPVNRVLSAKCFVPLSRLTYPAFLVHPIIMASFYGTRQASFQFSHYLMLYLILGNIVITYASAFVLAVLVELPLLSIERTLSRRVFRASDRA